MNHQLLKTKLSVYGIILLFILTPMLSSGDVPQRINYQGKLTDPATGNPLDGFYSMAFHLFDHPAVGTGTELWSESQTVEVNGGQGGVFNVLLGEAIPLDVYDFEVDNAGGMQLYLEIRILQSSLGWQTLTPRQKLTSTPFAMKAGDTDTLGGYRALDFAPAIHEHDGDYVNAGETNAITSSMIATGAVHTDDVADNSLTANDLATGSVGSSEIADGTVDIEDLADGSVIKEIIDDDGSGSNLDADLFDGFDSGDFSLAGHLHDSRYVNTAGDTMTGNLTIESTSLGTGIDVDLETTWSNIGMDLNVTSSNGIPQGIRINAIAGSKSNSPAFGINADIFQHSDQDLYGLEVTAQHTGLSGDAYGLNADIDGSDAGDVMGVYADAHKTSADTDGEAYGGYFIGDNDRSGGASYGVLGEATGLNGSKYGVYGRATTSGDGRSNYGVYARATSSDARAYGIYSDVDVFTSEADESYGAYTSVGAQAGSDVSITGYRSYVAHAGESGSTFGFYTDVYPSDTGNGYGIYATVSDGATTGETYAGLFSGDVRIYGTLIKSGGSFKIDHPLDPENKYLQHSFVESPDMMNIYNGNVLLDENGEAWVALPDYFKALNKDFRYQLTCIGGFAPVYIAQKISDNRFKISGGQPALEVSWQVTGIRQDAWAQVNRIQVELDKPEGETDFYLHPEVFGQDEEKGVEWARNPKMMRERHKNSDKQIDRRQAIK